MAVGRDSTSKSKPKVRVKPPKLTGVFTGLKPATATLTDAQKKAAKKTLDATRKAQKDVVVPDVPKLKNPTSRQRAAAGSVVAKSLNRQGVKTDVQLAALPEQQKVRVRRALGYRRTATEQARVAKAALAGREGTLAELEAEGARMEVEDRAKPGTKPTKIRLPGATINVTAGARVVKDSLAGNPLSAFVKGTGKILDEGSKAKGPLAIPARFTRDVVDLPANTVTSLYALGKEGAKGHPVGAAKVLVEPVVETVKHPVKSFTEHPLNTYLIGRGVKGAVGHGAGGVMRVAPSQTTRRLASTKRTAKVTPGMQRAKNRQYSRDVITKAGQVIVEKVQARRGKETGRMSDKDIKRAVNEDVQAAKVIQGDDVARMTHEAQKVLNVPTTLRGKVKAKATRQPKVTAATNLAAQGVTTASRKDLAKYLAEIKVAARDANLTRDELARNVETQRLIEKALKNHDPVAVQRAAEAYSKFVEPLEQQVIAHRIVDPHVAETTRLAGVKARRVKRSGPTLQAKEQTGRDVKDARAIAGRADAEYTRALTEAREAARTNKGRVPPREHDTLLRAIDIRDTAHAALAQAQTASRAAKTAHTRAFMPQGMPEPAYVSHQPLAPRAAALPTTKPKVRVNARRTGDAVAKGILDAHPAKLIEQAAGTQRLISAAKARNQFIDNYGFRGSSAAVNTFKNTKAAEKFAQTQDLKARTGQDWTPVRREDGDVSLVPKVAHDQLREFESAVDAQHPIARGIGTQWRRNVLAFSPRWLTGNTLEASVRSLAAGAGPMSQVTARRVLKAADPATHQELLARTASSGQYSTVARLVEDRQVGTGKDLGRFAQAVATLRKTHGPKELADAYGWYTNLVFRSLNGRLETQFRIGMLGRALRNHPLMESTVLKVSSQAVEDAARGLKNTNAQAELGRLVDDMYGRYDKYSPELQAAVANYTPFIAWTLNATNFLYHVLPRDHPITTSLLASANTATEKWRKQHGLYLDFLGQTDGQVPPWLQGSIPGEGGSHLRLSRYTPFGLLAQEGSTPLAGLQGLLLPQLSEITANLAGKDWQGKSLSKDGDRPIVDVIAAAASFLEGQIPLAAQVAHVTGVRLPNMREGQTIDPSLTVRLRKQFDPFMYTPGKKPTGSTSATGWGDTGAQGTWGDQAEQGSWGG